MTTEEKCPTNVWNEFHFTVCNRPVKRDGMCGIHAGAKDRVARKASEREAKWAEEKEAAALRKAKAPELLARLERHGLTAIIDLYSGSVQIGSAEDVADALDAKYRRSVTSP